MADIFNAVRRIAASAWYGTGFTEMPAANQNGYRSTGPDRTGLYVAIAG
jgi:hypothetical protein